MKRIRSLMQSRLRLLYLHPRRCCGVASPPWRFPSCLLKWPGRPNGQPSLHASHSASAADAPAYSSGPASLSSVGCRLPYLSAPDNKSQPRGGVLGCCAQRRPESIGAPLLASASAHRVLRGLRLPPPLAGLVPHAPTARDSPTVKLWCSSRTTFAAFGDHAFI